MKNVWKCDYCEKTFSIEEIAKEHEESCGKNPKNKITNKTILRLSMIYEEMDCIIASALAKTEIHDYDVLLSEIMRANKYNCPFTVYQNRQRIVNCIQKSVSIQSKRMGLKKTRLQEIEAEYPELLAAATQTIERRAWNEWDG